MPVRVQLHVDASCRQSPNLVGRHDVKDAQLAQNPLMYGWICDHSFTFVHFGLPSLELRFDQRDEFSGGTQQSNSRGEQLLQRDEGTIDYHQIDRRKRLRKGRRR